jgi:hypothetical protein
VASELDDLREQLATDSRRLTAVEEQPSAEAALRAAMDTDQSNLTIRLDAQDNLLRALSITQSDHTARLGRLEAAMGRGEAGIQAILELLRGSGAGGN